MNFFKTHLYLLGAIFFALFFVSLLLVTYVFSIENKIVIGLCFIPLPFGILLMWLGMNSDKENEDRRAVKRKPHKITSPSLEESERDDDFRRREAFRAAEREKLERAAQELEQMRADDRKDAEWRMNGEQPDFGSLISVHGWDVTVRSCVPILYPELFHRPTEKTAVLPVGEPTPELCLYDEGDLVARYRLEGEPGEDFTGKFFHLSVRFYNQGKPEAPVVLMDGFLSDSDAPDEAITFAKTGYRMEACFVGGRVASRRTAALRGADVEMKALRYPGIITPGNVRYLGMCGECGRSFMFHSYNFPHMNMIPAYSDDGLDVCSVPVNEIPDAENWDSVIDGVHFSTHNAFCCPHCGAPYIDYKSFPWMMRYGVYGAAHRGRKIVNYHQ